MRFLYFGDFHNRPTSPENRLDNFQESMREKTMEILSLGKTHKVSGFLQPGDFWDTPNPPLDFASEIIQRWTNVDVFELLQKLFMDGSWLLEDPDSSADEQLRKTINQIKESLKDYIPMVGLAGNHELFGNNLNTLPKTMLGFMTRLGLMKFATKENPFFFTTEDGLKVAITGTHYHLDIDSPEYLDDYIVEEKLGDVHIHMVHGYLTDKSKGDLFRHTLIDQIKQTQADLTVTGHDHIGFPLTEVDGKYFVNPGAIPRLSNDLKEINRTIKVLLIDITKAHGLRLKEIPLKSAKPGAMVLNRTKIVEKKAKEVRLEEFKKAVREAGVKKATNINEIIRNLADNQQLEPNVRDKTVERITEKMQEMNSDTHGVLGEAYITKLVLENFQSHEYTELDFSKGFNIFVGESHQGKTAVLRALNWIYENKPTGKRIIRIGADYAKATVFLSNGYVITRVIEAKRGGKNGYEITDPSTGEVSMHNTKILPEVQKLLGYTLLNIDKDLAFSLNFLKQGTGWFLIGDQYSAPQKAKIIGGIYGTQYADAVIRDVDSEMKQSNEKIKTAQKFLQQTEEKIQSFDYLPSMKTAIKALEQMIEEVERLEQRKTQIQKLLDRRTELTEKIVENENILNGLMPMDGISVILSDTKNAERLRSDLSQWLEKHSKISYSLKHIYHSLNVLQNLDEARALFQDTQAQVQRRSNLEQTVLRHESLTAQIEEQDKLIEATEQIEVSKSILRKTEAVVRTRQEMEQKVERAKELTQKRQKHKRSLDAIAHTLRETQRIEDARKLLDDMHSSIGKREEIEKLLSTRKRLDGQIQQEAKQVVYTNEAIERDVKVYQEVLESAGQCPVCFGNVDNATINRIVSTYIKH